LLDAGNIKSLFTSEYIQNNHAVLQMHQ